jgi:hypothetical protein
MNRVAAPKPLTKEQLLAIALDVERGWDARNAPKAAAA